jgi:hypothetical protein
MAAVADGLRSVLTSLPSLRPFGRRRKEQMGEAFARPFAHPVVFFRQRDWQINRCHEPVPLRVVEPLISPAQRPFLAVCDETIGQIDRAVNCLDNSFFSSATPSVISIA